MFLILNHRLSGRTLFGGWRCFKRGLFKNRGVFLIEALLSIVIISIGLTLIIQSLLNSYRANVLNVNYGKALMLLTNDFARLTRTSFSKFEDVSDSLEPFTQYRLETTIGKLTSMNDVINQVHLKVHWPSGMRESAIVLTTFLLKPPENEQTK